VLHIFSFTHIVWLSCVFNRSSSLSMPQVATKSRNIESSQQVHTPKAVGSSVVLASMVASELTNNTIAPNYVQLVSPASPVQGSYCTGSKRAFSSTSGPHHETPGPEESDAEECPVEGSNDNKAFHQSSVSNKRRRSTVEAGLSTTMSVAQLSELATLCDKHDISHFFSSVETCRWINALWKGDKPINGNWGTWLAILETFKQSTLREKVISVLATNMFVSEGEWVIAREDGPHPISQINCRAKASLQGKYCLNFLWKMLNSVQRCS
jgi:hypothetical protein